MRPAPIFLWRRLGFHAALLSRAPSSLRRSRARTFFFVARRCFVVVTDARRRLVGAQTVLRAPNGSTWLKSSRKMVKRKRKGGVSPVSPFKNEWLRTIGLPLWLRTVTLTIRTIEISFSITASYGGVTKQRETFRLPSILFAFHFVCC